MQLDATQWICRIAHLKILRFFVLSVLNAHLNQVRLTAWLPSEAALSNLTIYWSIHLKSGDKRTTFHVQATPTWKHYLSENWLDWQTRIWRQNTNFIIKKYFFLFRNWPFKRGVSSRHLTPHNSNFGTWRNRGCSFDKFMHFFKARNIFDSFRSWGVH